MTVGDRIRIKRTELGMTQDELAKKLGYSSRSTVNKMESATELSLKKVEKLAKVFGCKPACLIGWNEDEFTIETAELDYELTMMPLNVKKYALILSSLPKEKQEHIFKTIDIMNENSKN